MKKLVISIDIQKDGIQVGSNIEGKTDTAYCPGDNIAQALGFANEIMGEWFRSWKYVQVTREINVRDALGGSITWTKGCVLSVDYPKGGSSGVCRAMPNGRGCLVPLNILAMKTIPYQCGSCDGSGFIGENFDPCRECEKRRKEGES